ncbi:MAG: SNF2-related protein [Deltaproteobacteria bacterium]
MQLMEFDGVSDEEARLAFGEDLCGFLDGTHLAPRTMNYLVGLHQQGHCRTLGELFDESTEAYRRFQRQPERVRDEVDFRLGRYLDDWQPSDRPRECRRGVASPVLAARREAPPAAPREPPSDARLALLAVRLASAEEILRGDGAQARLGKLRIAGVELRDDPFFAHVRVEDANALWYPPQRVELRLGGSAPVSVRCRCWAEGGCDHRLAAVRHLLDVVHGPESALRNEMAAAAARPDWERFLRSVGELPATPTPEAPKVRLAFRVTAAEGKATVEQIVQRRVKSGAWSKGSKVRIDRMEEELDPSPSELRSILLLQSLRYDGGSQAGTRSFALLESLVGHPVVLLEGGPREPLPVRRTPVTLGFLPSGDDWLPQLTAEGEPLPVEILQRLAIEGQAVWGAATAIRLLEIGPELRRIASSLVRYEGVSVPAEGAKALVSKLAPLGERAPLDLPEPLEGERIPADSSPLLRLESSPGGGLVVELRVRPLPGGSSLPPGEGPTRLFGVHESRRVATRREMAAELEQAGALAATLPLDGALETSPWRWELPPGDGALDLLSALQARAEAGTPVEWRERPARIVHGATAKNLRVEVKDRRDWFGLEGGLEIDGERVELALLLDAARAERRYVPVGEGKWVEISAELRGRLARAAAVVHTGRSGLEVGFAAAEALTQAFDEVTELSACARWRETTQKLARARHFDPPLPRGLKAELRPYQLEGYRWLRRLAEWGVGACLADDMGLGKTVQTLAVLLARAKEGPALVIAPTSVGFNWLREAERFTPGLRPILYRDGDRDALLSGLGKGDLLIASYGLVVRDAARFTATRFATLVIDEAQAIKNPETRRARAVRDLNADWRVALTGTPVENHLGELWSVFRCACPGLLGSWEQFRERFAVPIERDRNARQREALALVLRPFVLRRTKAKVAPELPGRTELVLRVEPSAGEKRLYDDARLAAVAKLSGRAESELSDGRFEVLAEITRLRQLACHPKLHDPRSTVPSSKLARCLELVGDLREGGHRALVFSQFVGHLSLVRAALDAQKISYQYLDGQTPAAERERRVDAFQRGEGELFLISLKAGGTGLNLTAADYVIHLDPWWNPAVEDQATDRAHRIGQTRPVTVYRLVTSGTIEETILTLHDEKRGLADGILAGADAAARLSTRELLSLLRG